jgi:hypothetical protein
VFALHVATKTIEVYRLSDHEMLLSRDAPLELGQWYRVRAELQGDKMTFFVDGQPVGSVTDNRSLAGAVGVAVQDTMKTLFDDFSVSGPNIPGNGLEASPLGKQIMLSWPNSVTNQGLIATPDLITPQWASVTNSPANDGGYFKLLLDFAPGNRYFILAPQQRQ